MRNSDCTILVASCDAYDDVLKPFATLWKKFWKDCPFAVTLVTETATEDYGVFSRVIPCGLGLTWGERLKAALKQVETPYVLFLCDDYFLSAPVDTDRILMRLEQAKKFDAANFRLITNPRNPMPFAQDETLGEYAKNTAYCIATQTGFWNKGFLENLLVGIKSIWEFERLCSFRVGGEKRPILVTMRKEFPFIDAVHKGCWEFYTLDVCRANGIELDLSKRGTPPLKVRIRELAKAAVFAIFPWTFIVKVQNLLGVGMKEKAKS